MFDFDILKGLIKFDNPYLMDDNNKNVPDLVTVSDNSEYLIFDANDLDDLGKLYPSFVVLEAGSCHSEVISSPCHCNDNDNDGPSATGLTIDDLQPENVSVSAYTIAFASALDTSDTQWDLYDSVQVVLPKLG
ncbi:hypothetical protein APHAL10511_008618 [Amanita phalloides]|nr:hypothetical protein APHAL10511_008618 [Amanita phalloides]